LTLAQPTRAQPSDAAPRKLRVMVVDDSAVFRRIVSDWIAQDAGLDLVATHPDGGLAVADVARSRPDVIVLDIEMPVMNGLSALPLLLKQKPGVRVIVVSTLSRRNADISLRALALGAVEYVTKPDAGQGGLGAQSFRADLLRKIKAVGHAKSFEAQARPVDRRLKPLAAEADAQIRLRPFSPVRPRILVIGASTGGPQALHGLLPAIAAELKDTTILITQHMPPSFTALFSEHLSRVVGRPVTEGVDGEKLAPGAILVAPGGRHMSIASRNGAPAVVLQDGPEINFCRPSVDPMFMSVAGVFRQATLGLVLTGMGSDGAQGAAEIAKQGGSVIAQDEPSSVVWGMPGAAAHAGCCSAILPLQQIAPKIVELFRGKVQ
jgi:two-component system chemotaxis response regulator CheB